MTIPAIKAFIDGHGLKFIGFDLKDDRRARIPRHCSPTPAGR